jgi:hypothetical protein
MGNCSPQFQELHHPDYPQFDNQSSHPSSYNYPTSSSQSTLEDTLKVFIELTCQAISDVKNATMENTQPIARMEGQIEYLVDEVTRIEEEEFQSQLMATRYYMIDEDDFSISYHEHAQATATLGSEAVFEEIANGPSLEDPFEESDAQIEFNLDLVLEQEEVLLDPTPETRPENGETIEISLPSTSSSAAEFEGEGGEEHLEHTVPPLNLNSSNDKEMSTEAHSFIIPPEGYQILKKKGWKGLVGHPHDRGRRCKFSFTFLYS